MQRRTALALPIATVCALAASSCATGNSAGASRTQWVVRTSEGFDALAFLGPLSGKPFYARYYEAEIAAFKPRLSTSVLDALAMLHAQADAEGQLLWPLLALIFSGAADDSIESLIAHLDTAESTLRPPFEASVYWDAPDWRRFIAGAPLLKIVLAGLRDAQFGELWAGRIALDAPRRQHELLALFARIDVIAEQERLLGRKLDARIEVNLLWFCRPHGVKV